MKGQNTWRRTCGWLALMILSLKAGAAAPVVRLQTNDVVALVGAGAWVGEQREGYLETALRHTHPGHRLRFRNFAWEGDTVSLRPREVNYPSVITLLRQYRATIALVQFGQSESYVGEGGVSAFQQDYARLLDELAAVTPRLVLITPLPFESLPPPNPDLSSRNASLARYVAAIRELGAQRRLPVIDLFASPIGPTGARLTMDGRQLSAQGLAVAALGIARATRLSDEPAVSDPAGWFAQSRLKVLREDVVAKNKLWASHVRPTNWAFLAGDRLDQPSSRDHRDRNIRWFPQEVEQFGQLLREAEMKLDQPSPDAR